MFPTLHRYVRRSAIIGLLLLLTGVALDLLPRPTFSAKKTSAERPPIIATGIQRPSGGVTDATPFLQAAYPGKMNISRTMRGAIVDYAVAVYAAEVTDSRRPDLAARYMHEVVIIVSDDKGIELLSAPIDVSGISVEAPSKYKSPYRSFYFAVNESFEQTTAINIGQYNGMRVYFSKYRLPLRSIDYPEAH